VVDALAHGCAVVSNTARGALEYVVQSDAGVAVDGMAPLRVTLEPYLHDLTAIEAAGRRAFAYAQTFFSIDAVATSTRHAMTRARE
jgi:hypothetical protein